MNRPVAVLALLPLLMSSCSTPATSSSSATPAAPSGKTVTWNEVARSGLVLTRLDPVIYERFSFKPDGTVTPVLGAGCVRLTAAPLSWRISNNRLQLWNHGSLYGEYRLLGTSSEEITVIDGTGKLARFRMSHS